MGIQTLEDYHRAEQPLEPWRGSATLDVTQLFERYHQDIYRLCLGMLGDSHEAEDATQEIFLRAHRAWDRFDPQRASARTWLGHIAVNYCRTALRKRKIRHLAARLFGATPADTQEHDGRLNLQVDMDAVLAALDEPHRSVVLLRYYLNYSCAEIAATLQINEGTVHSRLYNARRRMQNLLACEETSHE